MVRFPGGQPKEGERERLGHEEKAGGRPFERPDRKKEKTTTTISGGGGLRRR